VSSSSLSHRNREGAPRRATDCYDTLRPLPSPHSRPSFPVAYRTRLRENLLARGIYPIALSPPPNPSHRAFRHATRSRRYNLSSRASSELSGVSIPNRTTSSGVNPIGMVVTLCTNATGTCTYADSREWFPRVCLGRGVNLSWRIVWSIPVTSSAFGTISHSSKLSGATLTGAGAPFLKGFHIMFL